MFNMYRNIPHMQSSLTCGSLLHVEVGIPLRTEITTSATKSNSSLPSIVDIGLCIVILTSAECSYHCNSIVKVLHT